jgi:hypothetical protein
MPLFHAGPSAAARSSNYNAPSDAGISTAPRAIIMRGVMRLWRPGSRARIESCAIRRQYVLSFLTSLKKNSLLTESQNAYDIHRLRERSMGYVRSVASQSSEGGKLLARCIRSSFHGKLESCFETVFHPGAYITGRCDPSEESGGSMPVSRPYACGHISHVSCHSLQIIDETGMQCDRQHVRYLSSARLPGTR